MKISTKILRLLTHSSLLMSFSLLESTPFPFDCLKSTGPTSPSSNINFSYQAGKGIGYNNGYSSIKAFLMKPESFNNYYPFIDCRWHHFDNGKNAVNFGIGTRTPLIGPNDIIGITFYYDYRQTKKQDFNQIGVSAEYLSDKVDIRINGYIPDGRRRSRSFDAIKKVHYDSSFIKFTNHSILIKGMTQDIKEKVEYSFYGGDAEIGKHLFESPGISLYGAFGGYYYLSRNGKNSLGSSGRILAKVTDYISVELNANYDSLFKTTANGIITVTIPFGPPPKLTFCRKNARSATIQRLVTPVHRQEIIPTKVHYKHSRIEDNGVLAVNPDTGNQYSVVFVNNTHSDDGTGSFDNPYNTLEAAQMGSDPGDIIYVFKGDGSAKGMSQGIVLQDDQRLYGAGDKIEIESQFGTTVIPEHSDYFPVIKNLNGDGVTLANHNVVEGFIFQDINGNGINGNQINGAIIRNNIISLPEKSGIYLKDCIGNLTIHSNIINFPNFADRGANLFIYNTGNTACTASITKNVLNTEYQSVFIITLDDSSVTSKIASNIINGVDEAHTGINIFAYDNSRQTTAISGNEIEDIGGVDGAGIAIFSAGGPSAIEARIEGNQIANCSTTSLMMATNTGSTLSALITGNTFSENGTAGVIVNTSSNSGGDLICIGLRENQSDNEYLLINEPGMLSPNTFNLEPIQNNVGTVTLVGEISSVPEDFCKFEVSKKEKNETLSSSNSSGSQHPFKQRH